MSFLSSNHSNCQLLGPAPAHKLGPRACLLVARDFHDDDTKKDLYLFISDCHLKSQLLAAINFYPIQIFAKSHMSMFSIKLLYKVKIRLHHVRVSG